jgi:hypothetical protein
LAGIDISTLTGTEAQIQAKLAAYDSGWRLPTNEENRMFVGNLPSDGNSRFAANDPTYYQVSDTWAEDYISDIGTGMFLKNPSRSGITLPASGYRYGNGNNTAAGTVDHIGLSGYGWSSTPSDDGTYGYYLGYAQSRVNVSDGTTGAAGYDKGLAVRCVRNQVVW